jgi:hypothetical protein
MTWHVKTVKTQTKQLKMNDKTIIELGYYKTDCMFNIRISEGGSGLTYHLTNKNHDYYSIEMA